MSNKALTQKATKKARPVTETASEGKHAAGAERYTLRTSDGKVLNLKASASSVEIIDKAAKRYSEAMKRLAKR
jgi:hypothetical protein